MTAARAAGFVLLATAGCAEWLGIDEIDERRRKMTDLNLPGDIKDAMPDGGPSTLPEAAPSDSGPGAGPDGHRPRCMNDIDCTGTPPECTTFECMQGRCAPVPVEPGAECGAGRVCNTEGVCIDRCVDGAKNGGETDIDCGGECPPCQAGGSCSANTDCELRLCVITVPPEQRCSDECQMDGVVNGGESDADCGAACARACGLGLSCSGDDDCLSGKCVDGICCGTACSGPCERCEPGTGACVPIAPYAPAPRCPGNSTCTEDSLCSFCRNGTYDGDLGETGLDCGGPCPVCRSDGDPCLVGTDCASCICENHQCRPQRCGNKTIDGCESDLDCGGLCGPCGIGQLCRTKLDCATSSCREGRCVAP